MRTRNLVWMLALTPLLWAALFWAFVLRARVALGHWPYPYHPDPKDLGFTLHYLALLAGMSVTFTAVAMALILTAVFYRRLRLDRAQPALAAFVGMLGIVGLLVWSRTDPGRFLAWLGD